MGARRDRQPSGGPTGRRWWSPALLAALLATVLGCSSSLTTSPEPPVPPRRALDALRATGLGPDALADGAQRAAHNPTADVARAGLLAEGAEGSGEVVVTFDDGPSIEHTPEVLRMLAAHHVTGAFFLGGERLAGMGVVAEVHRQLARAIAAAGHVVGNHALDHEPLERCLDDAAWCALQIDGAAARIARATGVEPRFFRPPYGRMVEPAQRLLARRGDELVLWTIDAQDVAERDPARIAHRLEQQLLFAGQGVVLLHELHGPSVRALGLLLEWLDAHRRDPVRGTGFTVVDLPTYLDHAAARPYPQASRLELLRARERRHVLGP